MQDRRRWFKSCRLRVAVGNDMASLDECTVTNTGVFSFCRTTPQQFGRTPSDYVHIGTPTAQLLWKLRNTNNSSAVDSVFDYGASNALPIPGNWDGVGASAAPGVVRADDGSGRLLWELRNASGAVQLPTRSTIAIKSFHG